MDAASLLYTTGEEVHAGDRVQYRGTFGTVVFVSDGETEEFLPGYEDYRGSERGVAVCDDDGSVESLSETTEDLVFLERA